MGRKEFRVCTYHTMYGDDDVRKWRNVIGTYRFLQLPSHHGSFEKPIKSPNFYSINCFVRLHMQK